MKLGRRSKASKNRIQEWRSQESGLQGHPSAKKVG